MEDYKVIKTKNRIIKSYGAESANSDPETVKSFGDEWTSFHGFSEADIKVTGDKYFDIVTPAMLNKDAMVIDIGCGSGRFIKYLNSNYKRIVGLDPSAAIFAADELLGADEKIELVQASADTIPYPDNYFDFGYSLGVLHHIPDTHRALNDCTAKIKPGGYFLLYLYYNLDNRSAIFKALFHLSNLFRKGISKLSQKPKKFFCDILAVLFYMPFVLFCRLLKLLGVPEKFRKRIPLQAYEDQSFYIIRNDSLDRFGTPLEQRFSQKEIRAMMEKAGLTDIVFSNKIPFWHAIGKKK